MTNTEYALCVYDRSGDNPVLAQSALVPPGGTCDGKPCWKPLSQGYKYKNRRGTQGGIQSIVLKGSIGDRAKLLVKGKGGHLALPTPVSTEEFFDQDPGVTIQLTNSAGFCWEATYDAPAQRNQPGRFKDKSD